MKRSKAYSKGAEQIDADALYAPLDAVRLAKATNPAGAAHPEGRLAHIGKQGIAIAALDEGAQGRVCGAHLLPPGRGLRD